MNSESDSLSDSAVKSGRGEYKWVPVMYVSYGLCVVLLMFIVPLPDTMKMLILIFMTTVYCGALGGLSTRALRRIEERLDQLG